MSSRNLTVDTLRGALLLVMAVNHIPSALRVITDQPFGFASSAEGFVLMSGFMAGRAYRGRGFDAAWKRVVKLWRAHCLTMFGVFAWTWLYFLWKGNPPFGAPLHFLARPAASLTAGFAFVFQPGLLDILPMYCGLIMMLPVVLKQLERGHADRVLSISLLWWAFTYSFDAPIVDGLLVTGAFDFGAWQLLFVVGVCFADGSARFHRASWKLASLASFAAIVLWCLRHELVPYQLELAWIDKPNLSPLRLLNVGLLLWFIFLTVRRWPELFRFGPLAMIGRHSLLVFCVHVVMAHVVLGLVPEDDPWQGTLVLLGSMWIAAWVAESRVRTDRRLREPRVELGQPGITLALWQGARRFDHATYFLDPTASEGELLRGEQGFPAGTVGHRLGE
ncbi:MAG: OpgC domain-containing protein [Polyangiales bacterium]